MTLADDLMTLAAVAAQSVVAAAATDAWEGLRTKIARLFGGGEAESQIERRLDATRGQLTAASDAELAQTRSAQTEAWKVRFADLLADHPEAIEDLAALVKAMTSKVSHGRDYSVVGGRDIAAKADHGSAAAIVVHGNIALDPTIPGPGIS